MDQMRTIDLNLEAGGLVLINLQLCLESWPQSCLNRWSVSDYKGKSAIGRQVRDASARMRRHSKSVVQKEIPAGPTPIQVEVSSNGWNSGKYM